MATAFDAFTRATIIHSNGVCRSDWSDFTIHRPLVRPEVCCAAGFRSGACPLWVNSHRMQRSKKLFDHLVGERKQLRWNFESERLGGLEVGDEFEFGRLHHRQIGGLGALEEAAGILADQTVGFGNA